VTGSSTGIASVHAPGASDLILRNVNTGAFEVYANAGNGGRFDQVLCSACVVGPPQDFPKLACQKAFEQELIGTKSEEELFNESRRALSASAANRRNTFIFARRFTTRIVRKSNKPPDGRWG